MQTHLFTPAKKSPARQKRLKELRPALTRALNGSKAENPDIAESCKNILYKRLCKGLVEQWHGLRERGTGKIWKYKVMSAYKARCKNVKARAEGYEWTLAEPP